MQQPASNYFLGIYGFFLEFETDQKGFLARLGYMERPEFTTQGYTDQEWTSFVMVGTTLLDFGYHGLMAHGGYGSVSGYTGVTSETGVLGVGYQAGIPEGIK